MSDAATFRVALTFDAEHPDRPWCPPDNDVRILDALRDAGVQATFFVQGRWAESQPVKAKRIADEGHLIGNHSHFHARVPLLSDDGFATDVREGQEAIVRITGRDPRPWFRCPFNAGRDDPRILGILDRMGYRHVDCDVELGDWEPWRTGPAIAEDARRGVREHGDGAVVMLHTWPGGTADAVPTILRELRELGAEFVTIDQLQELPT